VIRLPDGGMDVEAWGGKANLTDVAAAIGLGQLRQVDEFTRRRRALAERYFTVWDHAVKMELPPADKRQDGNWHMFQPLLGRELAARRGEFIAAMRAQGIGVGVHYPAMHLFSMFQKMGHAPGDFPVAEDIGRRTVTLPLFPAMDPTDVDRVCTAVKTALDTLQEGTHA
jgi:hypothetical protein